MNEALDVVRLGLVLKQAKNVAIQFHKLTGRHLGITGEIAEYEAARILKLTLAKKQQAGFDAFRVSGKKRERIQIKGKQLTSTNPGQKLGKLDPAKAWDSVVLVLLNEAYEPIEIYESKRRKVIAELQKPGSKARNERGQLSLGTFKKIAKQVWHC